MHLYLNFSLFYYIAIRNNVPGLTNPEIFSILTDQDPSVSQYPGSSCSFFFNGKRDIPKSIRSRMRNLTQEQLLHILAALHVRNVSHTINIFYWLLKEGIIPVQEYPKQLLLEQLSSETDHMKCLSLIYREALLDVSPKLQLTMELRSSLDQYIGEYCTRNRLRAISDSKPLFLNQDGNHTDQNLSHSSDTTDSVQSGMFSAVKSEKKPSDITPLSDNDSSKTLQIPYRKVFHDAASAICMRLNCITLPDGRIAYGWFRTLDFRDRISAFATADGICIAGLTFCTDPIYVAHRQEMLDYLITCRKGNGGFAGFDQRFPSYETTAAIAEAFFYERDFDHYRIVCDDLIRMWKKWGASTYKDGLSSVYLSTMILVLLGGSCPDDVLTSMEQYLTDQAIRNPVTGEILYWNPPSVPYLSGSCAHTAPAVLALLEIGKRRGNYTEIQQKLQYTIKWLISAQWRDMTEITYRKAVIDGTVLEDVTSFDHFPPPWCIRALLAAGIPKNHPRLIKEMKKLLDSQQDGLWYFSVSLTPQIWMTHEILQCFRDYQNT